MIRLKLVRLYFTLEDGKTQPKKSDEKSTDKKEEGKENKPADGKEVKTPADNKPKQEVKNKVGSKKIIEFKLPELGENIESADIINVLVSKGDSIERDQSIMEIETDKATIEVPSDVSGKVIDVLVKAGDKAKVGQTIIKVESVETREKAEETEAKVSEEVEIQIKKPEEIEKIKRSRWQA